MMPLSMLLALVVQLPQTAMDSAVAAVFDAEQGRAGTATQLAVLVNASRHADTIVQRLAVRALGRLEQPSVLPTLAMALEVGAPGVRIEAANAVAQSHYRVDGGGALNVLAARLAEERDAAVRGALLAAMGRLRLGGPDAAPSRDASRLILEGIQAGGGQETGAVRGAWDLVRRQGRSAVISADLREALRRQLASAGNPEVRRLALMALSAGREADSAAVTTGFRDADPQVRRLAVLAARTGTEIPGRNRIFAAALHDAEVMVRIEAVRGWAAHGRVTEGCEPLIAAVRDPVIAIQLLAIEALGAGCGPMQAPSDLLDAISREPVTASTWHRPVRALSALAQADSARAHLRLGSFTAQPVWWVRMHAAAVAQRLGDRPALYRLVVDSVDNVREAALRGLVALDGHGADAVAIGQLGRSDFQLALTAARALRGSSRAAEVAAASLAAFQRISAEGRQTSRDPRMALLDRIEEFGAAAHGAVLAELPADVDSVVGARVAALASRLTGRSTRARVQEPARPALPPLAVLRTMSRATIVLDDGTRLELALRPLEAPGGVTRFLEMAAGGWFDGLTLHRVVPNFVLQGGSPGANEYEGGAWFSRDEVGGAHRRGTMGISTRGRDTGDGQLFINLVDNLNLDHEYTVVGEIVAGAGVLDRVLEGALIRRIELP